MKGIRSITCVCCNARLDSMGLRSSCVFKRWLVKSSWCSEACKDFAMQGPCKTEQVSPAPSSSLHIDLLLSSPIADLRLSRICNPISTSHPATWPAHLPFLSTKVHRAKQCLAEPSLSFLYERLHFFFFPFKPLHPSASSTVWGRWQPPFQPFFILFLHFPSSLSFPAPTIAPIPVRERWSNPLFTSGEWSSVSERFAHCSRYYTSNLGQDFGLFA